MGVVSPMEHRGRALGQLSGAAVPGEPIFRECVLRTSCTSHCRLLYRFGILLSLEKYTKVRLLNLKALTRWF